MAQALQRRPELRRFFPPDRMVKLRQEGGNRNPNQAAVSWSEQLDSRLIGELDGAAFVDGHNRGLPRLPVDKTNLGVSLCSAIR
jgi:hypothetical protein